MKRFIMRPSVMILMTSVATCFADGSTDTTSTYQGELKLKGNLADGSFDMEFSMWDAAANGVSVQ